LVIRDSETAPGSTGGVCQQVGAFGARVVDGKIFAGGNLRWYGTDKNEVFFHYKKTEFIVDFT
jgi:hypothetical protein